MSFRPKKQPIQFADLKSVLAQSKNLDNPVYQVLQVILERLTTFSASVDKSLKDAANGSGIENTATKFATYLTTESEINALPHSVQLLAGAGITFDDTVPHKRTIKGTGSGGYAPMSTGAEPLEIMSNGAGQVLMIGFSE